MTQSEPGGLWLLNEATNDLTYVETHKDSTIASTWPVVDSEHLYAIQRGCDWLLNAAGAGLESYRRALRARWPGDTRGIPMEYPKPWQFWHRTIHGLSGGATRRMFAGDLARATRVNGFTIDDSKDGDTVTGWPGGNNASQLRTTLGQGPGRGGGGSSGGRGGGGGGAGAAGQAGSAGSTNLDAGFPGLAVSPYYVLEAVITNDYARENWLASGGGGGGRNNPGGDGGAAGGGLLRIGLNSLTESTTRTQTGSNGQSSTVPNPAGGGGGGGVYLAITGGDYTQAAGVNINCDGGNGGVSGSGTDRTGGAGGNGHIIIMAHGDITFEATSTRTNAVVTQWRIITAPPPGGSLISS